MNSKPIHDKFANSLDDLPVNELKHYSSHKANTLAPSNYNMIADNDITEVESAQCQPSTYANLFCNPQDISESPLAAITNIIPAELNQSARKHERDASGDIYDSDYTILVVEKNDGKEEISEGNASWTWTWTDMKENLQLEENHSIWYTKSGAGQCIIDDDASYSRFLQWARLQNRAGESIRVEIVRGWPEP